MSGFEARRAAQNHAENAGRIVEAAGRPKLRLLLELVSSVTAGLVYVGDAIAEATPKLEGFHQFPPEGVQGPADRRLVELTLDEIEALDDGMAYFAMSDYGQGDLRPLDAEQEEKRRAAKSAQEKIQAARGDGHGSE